MPIFISHSCKDRVIESPSPDMTPDELSRLRFARDVRSEIVRTLGRGESGHEFWFDRDRLRAGDEWELEIVRHLHSCDAALLLLSPEALRSEWVLREAQILADRKLRWPKFPIVPVLFAGVESKQLTDQRWWRVLRLDRWQVIQATHGACEGEDAKADLDEIVRAVAARLGRRQVARDEHFEGWAEEVTAFLLQFKDAQLGRLHAAAKGLRLRRPPAWDDEAVGWLARALLNSDVSTGTGQAVRTSTVPLLHAVSELVSIDPESVPATDDERRFCLQVQPVAAPTGVSIVVGSALPSAGGKGVVIVGLGESAKVRRLANLAAKRATCNRAFVRAITEVEGGQGIEALDVTRIREDVNRFRRAGRQCFIVVRLVVFEDDDPAELVQRLTSRLELSDNAALIVVMSREIVDEIGWLSAESGQLAVVVPQDLEEASLVIAEDLDHYLGEAS